MTPTHEHYIAKGNIVPKFRDTITVPSALNLTGATFKFRYSKPDSAVVERTATFVAVETGGGTVAAATVFTLEWAPTSDDTGVAGVFNYQWRVIFPSEATPLDLPLEVANEDDGSPRKFLRFEVTTTL